MLSPGHKIAQTMSRTVGLVPPLGRTGSPGDNPRGLTAVHEHGKETRNDQSRCARSGSVNGVVLGRRATATERAHGGVRIGRRGEGSANAGRRARPELCQRSRGHPLDLGGGLGARGCRRMPAGQRRRGRSASTASLDRADARGITREPCHRLHAAGSRGRPIQKGRAWPASRRRCDRSRALGLCGSDRAAGQAQGTAEPMQGSAAAVQG